MGQIDVDMRSLKRTLAKVESSVEDALDDATENALDEAIRRGKEHIKDEEAVWRREVLGRTMHAEFDWTELSDSEVYVIYNSARHAGVVDEGADFESPPDADNLVPWVLDNLRDWDPEGYDGDGDPSDGMGDRGSEDDDEFAPGNATIVGDRHIYDDGVFGVYHNRRVGNPTPYSYDLSEKVGYHRTESVSPFFGADSYEVLNSNEEGVMISELKTQFGDDRVNDFLDKIGTWKESPLTEEGQFLEKAAKQAYEIDADLRGEGSIQSPDPDDEYVELFHELSIASQEVLNQNVADDNGKINLYRGMNEYQTGELGEEVFNNPEASRWSHSDTVFQNYTIRKDVADEFAKGMEVEVTADVEDNTLLAPDFIFEDSIQFIRNAEVHAVGGDRHFSRDSVTFNGYSPEVILDKKLDDFSPDEHDAMKAVVDNMYDRDAFVENDEGIDRLNKWANEYDSVIGDDPDIIEKVDDITGQFSGVDYSDEVNTSTTAVDTLDSDTSVTSTIRDRVDYSDTESQQVKSTTSYQRLVPGEIGDLENTIRGEFGNDAFETTADLIESWKNGPSSLTAAKFETLAKQTHNIDARVRFGREYDIDDFTEDEKKAFNELTQASHDFIAENMGDRNGYVKLHRGFGETQTALMATEILDNQGASEWSMTSTVLDGYSYSSEISDYHSEGLEAHITVSAGEQTVIAPDNLLDDDYLPFHDGEVFVVGGDRTYSTDSITMKGTDISKLLDKPISDWTPAELEQFKYLVDAMYAKNQKVSTTAAKNQLEDWLNEYESVIGEDPDADEKVAEITENV